jgi:hypothetical protein
MPQGQRRIRTQFWFVLIFVALLAYALIATWWKQHAVLAWVITGSIAAIFAFSIYRFPAFRARLFNTAKTATQGLIYEPTQSTAVSGREPIPEHTRTHILQRSQYKCENPDCNSNTKPEIHHIDNDNSNNNPRNLIALCHPCHNAPHNNKFTNSQLRNWVRRSWASFRDRQQRRFHA